MVSARTMSVVVPAYNEMGNIENAVKDVVHALRTFDDYEVIIVNDGSKDGTGEVARGGEGQRILDGPATRNGRDLRVGHGAPGGVTEGDRGYEGFRSGSLDLLDVGGGVGAHEFCQFRGRIGCVRSA